MLNCCLPSLELAGDEEMPRHPGIASEEIGTIVGAGADR
jgi:hypothetical protein